MANTHLDVNGEDRCHELFEAISHVPLQPAFTAGLDSSRRGRLDGRPGTGLSGGEDHDELGVVVEDAAVVLGLDDRAKSS